MLEAIKADKDFRTVLESVGIELSSNIIMSKYDGAICAENSFEVLNNAVANINELDINELQVSIEITDNPMIQCAQRCE